VENYLRILRVAEVSVTRHVLSPPTASRCFPADLSDCLTAADTPRWRGWDRIPGRVGTTGIPLFVWRQTESERPAKAARAIFAF